MKQIIRHSLTYILILAILAGYTGIPLSKMICRQDGHVEVAISESNTACHHEAVQVKSCCKPVKKQDKDGCCDFDHDFLKIYTNTLVQQVKNETGYQAEYSVLFLSYWSTTLLFSQEKLTGGIQNTPPPDASTGSSRQSIIQVFRI